MWWKVLLTVWLVSVAMPGANAQMGGSSYEMMYPEDPEPDPNCDCDVDMMILVDGSSSVGRDAFQLARDYIAHLIECFNCTNVGLLYCKCESKICIPFCVYDNIPDLITAVGEVPYFNGSKTRVGHCIYHAQCTTNWREGVPDVIVVLSDGQIYGTYEWGYYDDVASYAQNARDAGITIYTAGIGRDGFIDQTGLEVIAGDDSRVVDTAVEDPSWLASIIALDQCGSCDILIDANKDKRPYPWDEDSTPMPMGGWEGCNFEPGFLKQVCKVFQSDSCSDEVKGPVSTATRGLFGSIFGQLRDFFAAVGKAIRDAINAIVEALVSLPNTIAAAISRIIDAMTIGADDIEGKIDEMLNGFEEELDQIAEDPSILRCVDPHTLAENFVDAFVDAIRELAGDDQETLETSIQSIIQHIEDILNNESDNLDTAAREYFEWLRELFQNYLEEMKKVSAYIGNSTAGFHCRVNHWLIQPKGSPLIIYPFPWPFPLPLPLPLPFPPPFPWP
ncbi:uncharacterized protein LOC144918849 [Branchiostoma floridae x Branchiostoma belcheri]